MVLTETLTETLSPSQLQEAREVGRAEARALLEGVARELEALLSLWAQQPQASVPGPDVLISAIHCATARLD